jgi:hypothetical protein
MAAELLAIIVRAKKYEHLTREQVMARWAEMMSRHSQWANDDDFEAELMAVFKVLGSKMGKRAEVLRSGGFDFDEPVQ